MDILRTTSSRPVSVKNDRSTHYLKRTIADVAQSKNKFQIVVREVQGLALLLHIFSFGF